METSESPRYSYREAMDHLNALLALPFAEDMQDWDIELADAAQVGEFYNRQARPAFPDTGRA